MSKTIKIAELAIDSKQLISELQKTKKEIDSLSAKQKELKKNGDTSSKTFIEQESRLKALKKEYNANSRVLNDVKTSQQVLNKELNRNVKSLEQAEQQNKALRKARANLNTETQEGKDSLEAINKKLDENTVYMKSNQDEQIQLKMNVGNYKDELLQTAGVSDAYTKGTKALNTIQAISTVVVGKSTGAMKAFKIALASTGIGLIVLAFGSLITYLTSTQDGIDKVNMVLTPLQEIMGSLLGVVQDLGADLFDSFSNPKEAMNDLYEFVKQNLINRFTAFSTILEGIINLDFKKIGDGIIQGTTGIEGASDKIKNFAKNTGEFFSEAYKRGQKIEELQQSLNKSEASFIKSQAVLNKEFQQQKKLSEDTTKSQSEREEAARKAIILQEAISKQKIKRIKQEAEILRLKQQSNDTSDADKVELAEKLAEIDKALEEEAGKTTEAQNKLNNIVKSGIDKRQKAREEAIKNKLKSLEEEASLVEAKLNSTNKTELEKLKENNKEALKILKYKYENGLISKTKYETDKLNIENEFKTKKEEKEAEQKEKEAEQNEEKLEQLRSFEEQKKALEDELYKSKLETDLERREFEIEQEQERFETDLERRLANEEISEEQFKVLKTLYAEKTEDELSKIRQKGVDDEEKKAEQKEKIEKALLENKIQMWGNAASILQGLADEQSAMGKALAVSDAIIQTYLGANKAFGQGGAAGFALAAAIIAKGLANVSKIVSTEPEKTSDENTNRAKNAKFARGGILKGNSHANGGIKTKFGELEGDEAIINKKSTRMFTPLLSAINEAGGGRKFANGGILNDNSISSNKMIDYDLLANKIASANMSLPSPIVGVNEINDVNNRVKVIENLSEF